MTAPAPAPTSGLANAVAKLSDIAALEPQSAQNVFELIDVIHELLVECAAVAVRRAD